MCGLTGFIRNPSMGGDTELEFTKLVFIELLAQAARRGKHATGWSAHNVKGEGIIWKIAMPAERAIMLPAFQASMDKVDSRAVIMQGHTRHATQNNAHRDECAHPFRFGPVVGAHNGMIYNWRQLEAEFKPAKPWQVDSEAVFEMLAKQKPAKVLDVLDGYWALTWVRGGKLFMCKTGEAQLACAYVPELGTMFWHSVKAVLEGVLKDAGLTFESWEVQHNRVYTYDPKRFDAEGTHPKREDVTFNGRVAKNWDTSKTDERALGGKGAVTLSPSAGRAERPVRKQPASGQLVLPMMNSLDDVRIEFATMWTAIGTLEQKVKELQERNEELEGEVERIDAENEHLFNVVRNSGLLEGTPPSDDTPPTEDDTEGDDWCVECGRSGAEVEHPHGWIHNACILPDGMATQREASRMLAAAEQAV